MPVAAGERDDERDAVAVDDQVVLRAGWRHEPPFESPDVRPIHGVFAQAQQAGAAQYGQQGSV